MNTALGRGSAMSANGRAMKDALMPVRLHRSNSLCIAWVFEAGQQSTGALGVVHIGRRHIDHERQAERVDEEMPLAPLHTFMGVKTTDACGLIDGLHRLGIHDRRAGM
jgi:hypothetical protein